MKTSELRLNRETILAIKRQHLRARQSKTPIEALIALAMMQRRPRYILNTTMDAAERVLLIGQISRSETFDPVSTALRYARMGVDAVSFFTDNAMYENDLDDLLMVAMGVKNLPVIYQNYIVDEYNVIEARASDASALVLHASALEREMLRRVVSTTQRWKMSAIVQVASREELEYAATIHPHAVAVDYSISQDIQRALERLQQLRPYVPYNTRLLLMNTLQSLEHVEAAIALGVDAVIIGEELLNDSAHHSHLHALLARH